NAAAVPPDQRSGGNEQSGGEEPGKETPCRRGFGEIGGSGQMGAAAGIERGDHGVQLEGEITRGLEALGGIFFEATANDALESGGEFRGEGQRGRIFF